MTRFPLALALTATAALALPAGAGAVIQVDRGIGGVSIGNTTSQVRTTLGKPDRVRTGNNPFGRFTVYRYIPESITVSFQNGDKVTSVSTTGVGDRTPRAVGVGSRERTVKQRVRGITCEVIAGDRACHTGYSRGTRPVTNFAIRRGRVVRVTVTLPTDPQRVTPPD